MRQSIEEMVKTLREIYNKEECVCVDEPPFLPAASAAQAGETCIACEAAHALDDVSETLWCALRDIQRRVEKKTWMS